MKRTTPPWCHRAAVAEVASRAAAAASTAAAGRGRGGFEGGRGRGGANDDGFGGWHNDKRRHNPRPSKISFPKYDGASDPLMWLTKCERTSVACAHWRWRRFGWHPYTSTALRRSGTTPSSETTGSSLGLASSTLSISASVRPSAPTASPSWRTFVARARWRTPAVPRPPLPQRRPLCLTTGEFVHGRPWITASY